MVRITALWLFVFAATLVFLFATARAYDYEQATVKRVKPRIGKALYCEGKPPAPVMCSLHGSRVIVRYWSSGIL